MAEEQRLQMSVRRQALPRDDFEPGTCEAGAPRDPLTEFQRELIALYASMMEGLRDEVVETFLRLRPEGGRIDLERVGLRAPTSTWTYLVNDNPFSSFGQSLIAMGNAGVSYATAYLGALYLPFTVAASAAALVRRLVTRGRSGPGHPGGQAGTGQPEPRD